MKICIWVQGAAGPQIMFHPQSKETTFSSPLKHLEHEQDLKEKLGKKLISSFFREHLPVTMHP